MTDSSYWDVAGLIAIVNVCFTGIMMGLIMFGTMFWQRALWLRYHDVPPQVGQVWNQNGGRLYVIAVSADRVRLRAYGYGENTEWEESMGAWKERVRNRHLYIMSRETTKIQRRMIDGTFK